MLFWIGIEIGKEMLLRKSFGITRTESLGLTFCVLLEAFSHAFGGLARMKANSVEATGYLELNLGQKLRAEMAARSCVTFE